MMSIAEVISMAMAELLVIILKVRGRHGRTYKYGQNNAKITLFFQVKLSYADIVGGVRANEGRHVDGNDGHHVEVGVGVLPN